MIDPFRTFGFIASASLRIGGWVAFAASIGVELAQLRHPETHWLGVVVLWTLVASALMHIGAAVLGGRSA